MRNKSLFIVAAIAAIAAATASVMVSSRANQQSAKATNAAPLFPSLRDNLNNVAKIKVKRGIPECTLVKVNDKWVIESRGNYPAQSDQVRQLIGGIAEAVILEPKTSKPELYDRLGVGDFEKAGATGTHVELIDPSGKPLAALIVGNTSREGADSDPAPKPRYFVRKDGDPQSYLAKGDLAAQADPMTWVNRSIAEIDGAKVKSVTVTHTPAGAAAPEVIRVSRASAAEPKFTLENLPPGRELKDEFKLTTIGQALSSLTMDDVAPAGGMDFSTPEATIEAHLFDGQTITAKMITKDNKKWWAFDAGYEEPPNTGRTTTPEAPKTDAPAPAEAAKAEADKAKSDEKAAAIKKVADLNEKTGPWAYALPDYKVTQVLVKLEDLLKPAETPPPTAPAPAPTPMPNDGGSLLGPH